MTTSTGGQGDRAHILEPWRRLASQLGPLIGDSGFCALFGRALRLARAAHDWPEPGSPCKSIDHQLAWLGEVLAAAEPAQAGAANAALLGRFTELLATLIGQALTDRILDASLGEDGLKKFVQEQSK